MKRGAKNLRELIAGNCRFVAGTGTCAGRSPAKRRALVRAQKPSAIIVSCSDSRVVPEFIFDCGLGQLFVVRAGGGALDKVLLGSVEFAVSGLGVRLIVLLAHERCAAIRIAAGRSEGVARNVAAVIRRISPAVQAARARGAGEHNLIERTTVEHLARSRRYLSAQSRVVRDLVDSGDLLVAGGIYRLGTGAVELLWS